MNVLALFLTVKGTRTYIQLTPTGSDLVRLTDHPGDDYAPRLVSGRKPRLYFFPTVTASTIPSHLSMNADGSGSLPPFG